ncbi:hypothetical protein SAICODRAFT_19169 [Saitoella complicata NRRL Y-17804]|uniref:uncharacterized protein n=1 Tax=Saitoella complicata (strain BCRC 22490 / CBS 7301 / JCM 7358 / NBRC 10748 / NRRL Y-17804) TaxID=698492 RepID=UPI000867B877|nr:uncharacterized protein SAICODRAFT_19169 [Saitoella complicata NRRL Y-17804]ODQ53246.1 hypothetical protein SAICODRAFT_19169 [Saitoella complicata NRRL Y-17804]
MSLSAKKSYGALSHHRSASPERSRTQRPSRSPAREQDQNVDDERTHKSMLTVALAKAQTAVTYDTANNTKMAIAAYAQACDLLSTVMQRTKAPEDHEKLSRIYSTYADRMRLLIAEAPAPETNKDLPPSPPAGEESDGEYQEYDHIDQDYEDDYNDIEEAVLGFGARIPSRLGPPSPMRPESGILGMNAMPQFYQQMNALNPSSMPPPPQFDPASVVSPGHRPPMTERQSSSTSTTATTSRTSLGFSAQRDSASTIATSPGNSPIRTHEPFHQQTGELPPSSRGHRRKKSSLSASGDFENVLGANDVQWLNTIDEVSSRTSSPSSRRTDPADTQPWQGRNSPNVQLRTEKGLSELFEDTDPEDDMDDTDRLLTEITRTLGLNDLDEGPEDEYNALNDSKRTSDASSEAALSHREGQVLRVPSVRQRRLPQIQNLSIRTVTESAKEPPEPSRPATAAAPQPPVMPSMPPPRAPLRAPAMSQRNFTAPLPQLVAPPMTKSSSSGGPPGSARMRPTTPRRVMTDYSVPMLNGWPGQRAYPPRAPGMLRMQSQNSLRSIDVTLAGRATPRNEDYSPTSSIFASSEYAMSSAASSFSLPMSGGAPDRKIDFFDDSLWDLTPVIEPQPESTLFRPFWLMRVILKSLREGAHLTPNLYIPQDIWMMKSVKLKAVDEKINACEILDNGLRRVGGVPYGDIESLLEALLQFRLVMEGVQATLTKKLGEEFGGDGGSERPGLGAGWKMSQATLSLKAKFKSKKDSGASKLNALSGENEVMFEGPNAAYMNALARMLDHAQTLEKMYGHFDVHNLPSKSQDRFNKSFRHASDFFGGVVCKFVMADVSVLLEKYLKTGREWMER